MPQNQRNLLKRVLFQKKYQQNKLFLKRYQLLLRPSLKKLRAISLKYQLHQHGETDRNRPHPLKAPLLVKCDRPKRFGDLVIK